MNNDRLNRREFIKATGAASALLAGGTLTQAWALPEPEQLSQKELNTLQTSIKANFGTGFEVISQSYRDSQLLVEIEHLENRYWVSPQNSIEWQIVDSTTR